MIHGLSPFWEFEAKQLKVSLLFDLALIFATAVPLGAVAYHEHTQAVAHCAPQAVSQSQTPAPSSK